MKAQLCKELNEEKFKNQVLVRSVCEIVKKQKLFKAHSFSPLSRKLKEASAGKKLVVGGLKTNRSMSIA